MRILYFAQARLSAGLSEETFHTTESLTAEKLWHLLIQRHPALLPLQSACRLGKNFHFLQIGETLQPDDEVAILPPVSGG
ncbi:MAG: MoaD/ThiS family protein [Verrucomicrobia bacterium]|nr:MoaD/ThiS family protein [Verrucomicrobiota bacterium]NBS86494.1 MoaD/ThiS family protein [Verrucomicrobiota bacterium]